MIAGAVYSYAEYRRVYSVSEVLARVQETARFAMGTIEPDIELAGFYGFTNNPDSVRWVRGAAPGTVLATAPRLRQRPLPPLPGAPVPAPDLDASAQACGTNFAVDVSIPGAGIEQWFFVRPGRRCELRSVRRRRGRQQRHADVAARRDGRERAGSGPPAGLCVALLEPHRATAVRRWRGARPH